MLWVTGCGLLADVLNIPDIGKFDFVFDRGCYHNVRYVDAKGFVQSLEQVVSEGARCLILSLNRNGPPGIREGTMRQDFADVFDITWMEPRSRQGENGEIPNASWSLMLTPKR